MQSTDRATSIIFGFAFAALVAIVFMVSSCTLSKATVDRTNDALRIKSSHILNAKCIEARGEWVHENYTDYCKFNK